MSKKYDPEDNNEDSSMGKNKIDPIKFLSYKSQEPVYKIKPSGAEITQFKQNEFKTKMDEFKKENKMEDDIKALERRALGSRPGEGKGLFIALGHMERAFESTKKYHAEQREKREKNFYDRVYGNDDDK